MATQRGLGGDTVDLVLISQPGVIHEIEDGHAVTADCLTGQLDAPDRVPRERAEEMVDDDRSRVRWCRFCAEGGSVLDAKNGLASALDERDPDEPWPIEQDEGED